MKKVFLSSVGRDLKEHRAKVIEAIEGLDGFHCVCMENFGARDWESDEFCRQKVAECDVFVGITGHVYGSIHEPSGKSFTEREYDAAVEGTKSRLMFLAPENYALPANWIEPDEIRAKQTALRQQVNRERIKDTFTSPDDLAGRVRQALFNWEKEQPKTKETAEVTRADIFPRAPQPYFAHPYPLQPNFTGRAKERKLLTEWFTSDNRPVFVYEAIGGMGKSAVTWVWVQRDVLGLPIPGIVGEQPEGCAVSESKRTAGVFWWSFYEADAKFGAFLSAALRYVGVRFDKDTSEHDKLLALVNALYQNKYLFVLDGFERELRAYFSMNAAYQGDKIKQDKRGDFRSCVDPRAAGFLQMVAAYQLQSRILMTSRLHPKELENLAGCRHENLSSFGIEDTQTYFHAQNIACTRAEVTEACRVCGFHPLSLSLLCGIITGSLKSPGKVDAASGFRITDELKGKNQHHILEASYNTLDNDQKALLSKLAAFRNPITYETALVFRKKGQREKTFESSIRNLLDRGLIFWENGYLDFHPIIRSYAYDRLTDKEGVHSQLRDYFEKVPGPEGKVQTIEELTPVIELYHHSIRADRLDDASNLYRSRLGEALYYQFGAYNLIIELISILFQDGLDKSPKLSDEWNQSYTMNELAIAFTRSGQSRKAIPLFKRAIGNYRKNKDTANESIVLRNLSFDNLALGQIKEAEKHLRASHKLEIEANNKYREAYSRQILGQPLAYRGCFTEADDELNLAVSSFELEKSAQGLALSRCHQAFAALLQDKYQTALDFSKKALQLWNKVANEKFPVERDRVQVEWLLGWSNTALANEKPKHKKKLLNEAEQHLTEALTRCRKINLIEFESDILLTWACWHRTKGYPGEARKCCDEALDIADRCEYRLKQADIHNFIALLELEAGNLPEAKRQAEIGKERALCDGPPYHYKPAYEESERLLKEIKAKS